MTIKDQTNNVRKAILARLKADSGLTALVPSARIYPHRTPTSLTWPFIKLGVINDLPYRPSGAIGSQNLFGTVHIFTKTGGAVLDAENQCHQIREHVARLIDAQSGIVVTGGTFYMSYDGGTVMQDGDDADAYHSVVNWQGWAVSGD